MLLKSASILVLTYRLMLTPRRKLGSSFSLSTRGREMDPSTRLKKSQLLQELYLIEGFSENLHLCLRHIVRV